MEVFTALVDFFRSAYKYTYRSSHDTKLYDPEVTNEEKNYGKDTAPLWRPSWAIKCSP